MATAVSRPANAAATVRCAIYTRKSTEEGLDQSFNTLDAQRDAAEAYIASQRHEGWIALPEKYDDGGYTGANMDRPALKRLLEDVRQGIVNCIVVYKVDRLTRSLLDFARIVEVLDKHGASFVSVTQQFNTTNSLGRLTLNILLSFAQFEREMIAERTKDKMGAARRRGKWIGGNLVLGYDVTPQGGSLVINPSAARRVREISALYLEYRSLISVVQELERRGWRTKAWTTKTGRNAGGKNFTKNRLYNLLTNIIYTGRVEFGGQVYEGEHERIVDDETWTNVQENLNRNGRRGGGNYRNKYGALLKPNRSSDSVSMRSRLPEVTTTSPWSMIWIGAGCCLWPKTGPRKVWTASGRVCRSSNERQSVESRWTCGTPTSTPLVSTFPKPTARSSSTSFTSPSIWGKPSIWSVAARTSSCKPPETIVSRALVTTGYVIPPGWNRTTASSLPLCATAT
jgi:DNA invertase Pin-like site-specific DNA recombinase